MTPSSITNRLWNRGLSGRTKHRMYIIKYHVNVAAEDTIVDATAGTHLSLFQRRLSFPYLSTMSTQKAVVHVSQGISELRSDVPLPKLPGDNWILVKTKAVALNPTDWKNIERATAPGAIAGCDYAGIVEEVSKDVISLKVGDRVAGFARGGKIIPRYSQ